MHVRLLLLPVLAACATTTLDPRADIASRLPEGNGVDADAALLREDVVIACRGYASRVRARDEGAWIGLLTAAARGGACLSEEDGDALAAWATSSADAPKWTGALAEWAQRRGKPVAAFTGFEGARLRIAFDQGRAVRELADAALAVEPRDALACWIAARASLAEGDLYATVEQAACEGTVNTRLLRVRADALDAAGDLDGAETAYREAGLDVQRAALLYQSGRVEEARALLGADLPDAALHRGWIARLAGAPVDLKGLDASTPALVLTALVTGDPTRAADADGPEGAVARGDHAAIEAARAADPAFEPLYRALGDREGWARVDPVHARLRGDRGSRDMPWAAIVPGAPFPPPSGPPDEVDEAWRAALGLPDRAARLDALAALQSAHPELRGLASARYAIAAGLELPRLDSTAPSP